MGGTASVRALWAQLRAKGVKIAAFWLQDWSGLEVASLYGIPYKRVRWNWQLDRSHYPGWEELLRDLHDAGIRVMTYINPYLALGDTQYTEAAAKGYLVKDAKGAPYIQASGGAAFKFTIDLTNPDA